MYVLRTVSKKMTSYNDSFKWPSYGPVVASDWCPDNVCGKGLHGLANGFGDSKLLDWDGKWMVLNVADSKLVWLDGKVKFPEAIVVFVGDQKGATNFLINRGVSTAIAGHAFVNSKSMLVSKFSDTRSFGLQWNSIKELCAGTSLSMRNETVSHMPDLLSIGGDLDMTGSVVGKMPTILITGGYLDMRDSEVCLNTSEQAKLVVNTDLFLNNHTTSLPANTIVGRDLVITRTRLKELPTQLTVGRDLYMRHMDIAIPTDIKIGGKIFS